MKASPYVTAVSVLVMLGVAAETLGAQDPTTKIRGASCLLRISAPKTVLPLNQEVIDRMLWSTPVMGGPVKELLGATPESYDKAVMVSFQILEQSQTQDQTTILGELVVSIQDGVEPRVGAEAFLTTMCQRLKETLSGVTTAEAARWETQSQAIEIELAALDQESQEIVAIQRDLYEKAGREDLAREPILDKIRQYESMKEDLRLRLMGANARQSAVTKQIAELTAQAEKKIQSNSILNGLQRIVEMRQKALERMRKLVDAGQATAEEAAKVEEDAIRAQTDLAHYLEQVRDTEGGGMAIAMNKQLVDLSIEVESVAAELSVVEQRLAEMRERHVLELAERYQSEVEIPKRMIDRRLMDLKEQQYQLKEKLRRMQLPEMQVLGQ